MQYLTKVKEFRLKLFPRNFSSVRKFYSDLLNYPVVKEWDRGEDDKGVMFDVGGNAVIEILSPRGEYVPVQGAGVSLEIYDVKSLYEELKGKVTITRDIHHTDWGDTAFSFTDPEGFELTYFTRD